MQPIMEIVHRCIGIHLDVVYGIVERHGISVSFVQLFYQYFGINRNEPVIVDYTLIFEISKRPLAIMIFLKVCNHNSLY